MHCPAIEKVPQTRYLGVIVDQRLSWFAHVDHVINRTRKLIWIFKTLRHVIPEKMDKMDSPKHLLNQIYISLAQSIITYCIPVWGGAAKSHFINLERAQRSLIKVMYFKKRRFPTEDLYCISGLLSVRKLYIILVTLKNHKSIPYVPHLPTRRQKNVACSKSIKTTFASRQFSYRSSFLFNKINKKLNIYKVNYTTAKKLLEEWVQLKPYDEIESILNCNL